MTDELTVWGTGRRKKKKENTEVQEEKPVPAPLCPPQTSRGLVRINPLNDELNPIRHLLALVGVRHIVHISRVRVKPGVEPEDEGIIRPPKRRKL